MAKATNVSHKLAWIARKVANDLTRMKTVLVPLWTKTQQMTKHTRAKLANKPRLFLAALLAD